MSCFLLTVALSTGASAQSDPFEQPPRPSSVHDQVQWLNAQAEARRAAFDREKREAEEFRQQMFVKKAREFVDSWNAFADEYQQGKFDIRKARELSKQFHQLEKRGGWSKTKEGDKIDLGACPLPRDEATQIGSRK
ncbi:MAG: hypothetical protein KIT09_34225 [Bryobacteraceae bacterium]|nr:hypothetical protein [Bryobacteraceae bacterium]